LIYGALGLPVPQFCHVSLILAPDRTKLSKRHGATSVGEFKQKGYSSEAIVNHLALLGWNDGTEKEIFSRADLMGTFSLDRITKSAAIFDNSKLDWINAQHIRLMPEDTLARQVCEAWESACLFGDGADSDACLDAAVAFVAMSRDGLTTVADAVPAMRDVLSFPLEDLMATPAGEKAARNFDLWPVARALVDRHQAGTLGAAVAAGPDAWKACVKDLGKELNLKGKKLFFPLRVALTGKTQGPDVGQSLGLVHIAQAKGLISNNKSGNEENQPFTISDRMETLKKLVEKQVANAKA